MSGLKKHAVFSVFLLLASLAGLKQVSLQAQTLDEKALKGMKWRQIGPFRGGRALAVTGVAGAPETYYFGAVAGGVWKTQNGGLTWTPMTDKTGIVSIGALAVAPSDPNVIYVGTGESCIRGNISYGDGMYKSVDGGKTWAHIGLGDTQHIAKIVVHPQNPDIVYVAALGHAYGPNEVRGVFRSSDGGGESWHLINSDHRYTQRAWYFHHIFADPRSVDTLYVLNTGVSRSTDGGKSFEAIRAPHGDNHGLWIDPTHPQWMIVANDGGASVSHDAGKSWTTEANQPTAQFYHVATDNGVPYKLYGAQQDNSTVAIASRSDSFAIDRPDWYDVGGGESGYVVPDPRNPHVVYAGSYDGLITRFDKSNGQEQDISSWPLNPMGAGAAELKHRFQWTAPIAISPNDPNTLYHGGEAVFKTTDGGMSWAAISGDLTRNDKSKQQSSGGPLTQDNTSVEYYDTVFTIAESPVEKGVIWAGSDDGLVHVTRDGGQHWTDVTSKEFGEWSLVSLIDASPHAAGTAYVAIDRHKLDDYKPYAFKTTDYGKSWTKITTGLPENSYVHAVKEDPKRKGLLFAGTENGIYVSFDDGGRWQSLRLNLPTTPVHDLTVKDDDLIVATHGRAFWILDDISPLRQMSAATVNEDAHLYQPATAIRYRGPGFTIRANVPVGANPPTGVIIDYFLKSAPKDAVELQILDGKGSVVRKLSSKKAAEGASPEEEEFGISRPSEKLPAEEGLNRFVWDMRGEAPARVPGAVSWGGRPTGVLVVPGTYQIKLTVGGKSLTTSAEVQKDPRVNVSPADLEKQYELAMRIRDRVNAGHEAVNQIRSVREQLDGLKKRLSGDTGAKAVLDSADALKKKIDAVEEKIIQPKSKSGEDPLNYPIQVTDQLMALQGTVESADAAPTAQSNAVFDELNGRLETQLTAWREIQSKDLLALNELMKKNNVEAIAPAAEKTKVASE